MSNKAAVLNQHGAPFVIEDRPIYKPEADELLVKVHALSTAPIDWKMQEYDGFIDKYPIILGSDIAGTVEAVGSNVTQFKKGDRVTAFAHVLQSKDSRNGAFQQYSIVTTRLAARIPDSLSFDEAAIVPISVSTAAVGIFLTLDIPRPPAKQQGAFLVWGASSSVGTAAVQIARSLGFTVFAVNSPRHNDYVKKLGATECFDHRDPEIVKKASQAIKATGHKANAYDVISEHNSAPKAAEILEAAGGGKLCLTLGYPKDARQPGNVEVVNAYVTRIAGDRKDFGQWLFNEWLEKSLADKTYVPSPAIQKVDGGIQAMQKAVDTHKAGLSGVKLVLNP